MPDPTPVDPKRHIITVVAVIRNAEGKYLVLKRRDTEKVYPGMYTFPGGKIEGFTSIPETLERETIEEANLRLKPGKVLLKDKTILRPDGSTSLSLSFLCEAENEDEARFDEKDFTDMRWVDTDELATLPHVGIVEELEKADWLYTLGEPFERLSTNSLKADLTTN